MKAIIFDLDGTLVDSMWIWKEIDITYLNRRGIDFPEDLQKDIEGMSFTETANYFKERFNLTDTIETIKEEWNSLAKDLHYARGGIIRERDPEMQLSVASSMNLVILCIAIWNTIYMQREIRSLMQEGYTTNQEDLRFLSPFGHTHINLYGQFHFQPLPRLDPLSAEKEFEPLW